MAKIVGIIGSGRGKLGNTVLAVRRGEQIARVYQPVVANPKSKRQQLSRAKMAVAVAGLRPIKLALRAGWNLSHPSYEFQKAVSIAIPANNLIITQLSPNAPPAMDMMALAPLLSADMLTKPSVTGLSFAQESQVDFSVTVPESARMDAGGNTVDVGLITTILNPAVNDAQVTFKPLSSDATPQAVSVKVPGVWSGMTVEVYCFLKQIPTAKNGIQSTALPWMYPAPTSGGVYIGEGEIS